MEVWRDFISGAAVSALFMGVFTASVGALYSMLSKRIDFDNDFLKRVISKRIQAVEAVELSLRPMMIITELHDGTRAHNFMLTGLRDENNRPVTAARQFDDLNKSLAHHQYWLSSAVNEKAHTLLDIYKNIHDNTPLLMFQKSETGDYEDIKGIIEDYSARLDAAMHALYRELQRDFATASDVKSFLKEKNIKKASRFQSVLETRSLLEAEPTSESRESGKTGHQDA